MHFFLGALRVEIGYVRVIDNFWVNKAILQGELSGTVLDWGVACSSLTSVTALYHSARNINPCLVLVLRRKTYPYITEIIADWDVKNQIKNKQQKNISTVESVYCLKLWFFYKKYAIIACIRETDRFILFYKHAVEIQMDFTNVFNNELSTC